MRVIPFEVVEEVCKSRLSRTRSVRTLRAVVLVILERKLDGAGVIPKVILMILESFLKRLLRRIAVLDVLEDLCQLSLGS